MNIRHALTACAAAILLTGMATFAQTTEQQKSEAPETQVTLVGCLQREADYRRANDAGKGGQLATGLGLDNEFVLVNASSAPGADIDCATAGAGEAYELTGNRERELARFVGQRIEITGIQKEADTIAGRPTGGLDPLGQDLKLFEVEINSFREASAPALAAAEPVTQAEPEPQPVGTSGVQDELPRTASPLPVAGLLGLLSLAGSFGVRALRRRR